MTCFGKPYLSNPNRRSRLSLDDHSDCEASISYNIDQKALTSGSHRSSCSSCSSSEDSRQGDPIADPKGRQPASLRRIASMSTALRTQQILASLEPMSQNSIANSDRQPQDRTTYTGKPGFAWPFHKTDMTIQLPLKEKSRKSLPPGAPKLRMVGRGGSGSQLRQVSLSNPAVSELNFHSPRQSPEPSASFHRPTGRGGLGSLSSRPPTPSKPSINILDLLRGRKRGPSPSLPENIVGPGHHEDIHSSVEGAHSSVEETESFVEEIHPTYHEHRQRSLNKLTRTLGALPPPDQLSNYPRTFNDSSKLSITTNLGDNSLEPLSFRHSWDSVIGTGRPRLTDDPPQSWLSLDNRASFGSDVCSPITFSPPSPSFVKNTPHDPEQISTPLNDDDCSLTTTSLITESETNSPPQWQISGTDPSSPPTKDIYISNHSTSQFDPVSIGNDLFPEPPDTQCNWLVPLETLNDELVISVTRTAPSKTQSWAGEWNDDIKDVIKSLRQL